MKQKNKLTKIITKLLAMIAFITVTTVGFTANKASAATNEISVISADSHMITHGAGVGVYRAQIEIKVKNIAYNKKVTVHYYDEYYREWKDFEAKYAKQLDDGYELWTADPVYVQGTEFAVKYEVNGQTYWDNNDGKNYHGKFMR